MRSGGGVLIVSTLQIIVGLVLLGVYEGYKAQYYDNFFIEETSPPPPPPSPPAAADPNDMYNLNGPTAAPKPVFVSVRSSSEQQGRFMSTPLDIIFYLSIINNVFSLFGLAGMFAAQKTLVLTFFSYNAANLVVSFHVFVDICTTIDIKSKHSASLLPYERTVAAFLFFNFVLSCTASVFAVKAVDEIKEKKRAGEYSVMNFESVHVDTPL